MSHGQRYLFTEIDSAQLRLRLRRCATESRLTINKRTDVCWEITITGPCEPDGCVCVRDPELALSPIGLPDPNSPDDTR